MTSSAPPDTPPRARLELERAELASARTQQADRINEGKALKDQVKYLTRKLQEQEMAPAEQSERGTHLTNFLNFTRFGSSASAPSRRFLSSS